MSDVFLYRVCNRCRNQLKYVSSTYFKKIVSENPNECKYCKSVLDASLESFKLGQYTRICPQCKRPVVYKTRESYGQAARANNICKSCSQIPVIAEKARKQREKWEPIIGRWDLRPKTLTMIKRHWNSLTDAEKVQILLKNQQQKDWYWGHLRRKNRYTKRRNCKATMAERYSGENHWMKRPEVLAKIRKSCEKYRGDGHWFRRSKTI